MPGGLPRAPRERHGSIQSSLHPLGCRLFFLAPDLCVGLTLCKVAERELATRRTQDTRETLMHIQAKPDFGVSACYIHRCGHQGRAMFYAGAEYAEHDRPNQEARSCLDCHSAMELRNIRAREEDAQVRRYNPRPVPLDAELDDPQLPRKGDFFINADSLIVSVERNLAGRYWLRRVPCNGIVYQTWVRDQHALQEFFEQRGFKLLRRDLH